MKFENIDHYKMASVQKCYKNLVKIFQGRYFVVSEPKNLKLLADVSFSGHFQNIVLPSLLLFLCACYYVDLDDIQ